MTEPELRYVVGVPEPRDHLLHVRLTLKGEALPEPLTVAMPAWAPGSYLIREFARHVEALTATGDGVAAGVRKVAKDAWAIAHGGAREVTVTYTVYARDLTVRTNHVDESFAWINGAATFLRPVGDALDWDALPCALALAVPLPMGAWRVYTPLELDASGGWRAKDFHELVDSPILLAAADHRHLTINGRVHTLAVVGHELALAYDGDRFARDVTRIIEAATALYGEAPYDRYFFHVILTPGGRGGLEHARAAAVMASPDAFETDDAYHDLLALIAHEFLHLWHVKRVRPAGLVPVDYARENHTRLLWLFEGGTSYFDRRVLLRARLLTVQQFLRHFAAEIAGLEDTPGRFAQSLEEASFDAWIKLYRPDEHTPNSTVSYYRKGAVACLLLDLTIRARSEGRRSLDDVMRHLWRAYGALDRPVPEEGVEALVAEATGVDVSDVIDGCVRSTRPLPYDATFALVGLGLRGKRVRGVTLGLRTRTEGGRMLVSAVLRGGPGAQAGVAPGDEIIGFAGRRVDEAALRERLRRGAALAGRPIEVLLARRERLFTFTVVPTGASPDTLEIFRVEGASPAAKMLAEWFLECAPVAPDDGETSR
jgi:predicted metalloprotease with PDZ domain